MVTYDISDDRERARVAKVLEGFGVRVQESVFECRLTVAYRNTLIERLNKLKLDSGYIHLYRLRRFTERVVIGEAPPPPVFDDENYAVVV